MSLGRRLLYTLLVLVGFLGAVELLGRLLPANDNRTPFAAHPERGWTLPASTTFTFSGVTATTNHLGLRSPEPQDAPRLRVLTLGDSSAFGDGVADTESFSAVLAARTGADVQNAGVPGYTCLQSASRYDDLVEVLSPDVLLVYSLHNDVRKITPEDAVWVNRAAGAGVLRLLSAGQRLVKMRWGESRVSAAGYRGCLSNLADRQAARGGVTLLIAPLERKHLEARGGQRPQGKGHQRPYREALASVAAERGLPSLDLTETSWAAGLPAEAILLDQVHPTAEGHARIAARIQETLAAAGVVWPDTGAPR